MHVLLQGKKYTNFFVYQISLDIYELLRLNLLIIFRVLSSVQEVLGGGLFVCLPSIRKV